MVNCTNQLKIRTFDPRLIGLVYKGLSHTNFQIQLSLLVKTPID